MRLEDIQEAIAELSTEELEELLKDIRHNRTKETILVTKVREKKDNIDKMLGNLSGDQIAALLKSLGG
jgi:DNA invertase Pin-like site-specific DNA recombinase